MPFRLHIVHEADARLWQRLDWIHSQLERLHQQNTAILSNQESIMATIKELVASVAEVKGKADSIGMLITQLREQIAGLIAGNLPADVQAQVDQAFADAEAAKAELSAAVDNPGTPTPVPGTPPTAPAPSGD